MKLGFYFINLLVLFVLFIILTIKIPIYFGNDWEFVGIHYLIKNNIIPCISFVFILGAIIFIILFKKSLKVTGDLPVKIEEVDLIGYESLEFLMTYMLPLVLFKPDGIREFIIIVIILIVIGAIYINSDLFYKNPTLALLGYSVYKAKCNNNECILFTKDKLKSGCTIRKLNVENNIYYCEIVK